jgi:hypothetical protein
VNELAALDDYLALQGVKSWRALPKRPQNKRGWSTRMEN